MFYYLRTSWVWLRRCAYSRGFGVQSPSAYSFIRYVVNEHYPYYAYREFRQNMPTVDKHTHKLGRLVFRLSNFWQPDFVCSFSEVYDSFVKGGCRGANIVSFDKYHLLCSKAHSIVILPAMAHGKINALLEHVNEKVLLLLVGRLENKLMREAWKQLQEDVRVGITYELYYCRIVFFDHSIYKQHYQVNF